MSKLETLLEDWRRNTAKALDRLEYSYKKVQKLQDKLAFFDEESLETWESFAARFARASDMFLSKYLRTKIMIEDPGFRGSFRDSLDLAEKLNIIDSADEWLRIRALRNSSVHEYTEEDLAQFFKEILKHSSRLLEVRKVL